MAIMMVLVSSCFTACSSDDDDSDGGGGNSKSLIVGRWILTEKYNSDGSPKSYLAATDGEGYDFDKDVLIRYKDVKRIYGYKINTYWSNIASVESYYKTNMDFLKPEVRDYFFRQYPDVYSKIDDLPPAKYNPGCEVKNSLVSSGSIINGYVENSIIFKDVFIGENCSVKNSIVLNGAYLGDNVHLENCIVESRDTIRPNSTYIGENEIKIVTETSERYTL